MNDPTGTQYKPEDLEALKRKHAGRWLISYRGFADGFRYDAVPLGAGRPRLVKETAAGLEEAIAAVEAGTWRP